MKNKVILTALLFAFFPLAVTSLMPEDSYNYYQPADHPCYQSWLRLMEM